MPRNKTRGTSAVQYYLRNKEDSLIVFSPLKYWKNSTWINLGFEKGYILNRRHFHTNSDTAISLILWRNETCLDGKSLSLEVVDIAEDPKTPTGPVKTKRVQYLFSDVFYDKRSDPSDVVQRPVLKGEGLHDLKALWSEANGSEYVSNHRGVRVNAVRSEAIIGYLIAQGNQTTNPRLRTNLVRLTNFGGNGFHLRADNFLEKLPMFAAGWWSTYNDKWWLDGVIYRSGDGAERFLADVKDKKPETMKWLHKVLFYTTMEYYTKIRSLNGSDGRLYLNELCLDNNIDHSGYEDELMRSLGDKTLAYKTLEDASFFDQMTGQEQEMCNLYQTILAQAKNTASYNPDFNYGLFQIDQELNTKHKERRGTREVNVYDYPELNGNLKTMRKLVKDYYRDEIVDGLFSYEFLK